MEMDETARGAVLQSEEDLQRMIELGAWYDGYEENNIASVEANSETEPIYNHNEFLWQVDKDEDDPEFSSPRGTQLPHTHTDIVQELLAKLAMAVDGYEETDFGPTTSTVVGSTQMPVPIGDSVPTNGESVGDQPATGGDGRDIAVDDSGSNGSHHGPEMASEAQSVSQTDGDSPAVKEKPRHYHIAHEILTSERTYVQGLRVLEKVVHGAVKTVAMNNRSVLPENVRKEIFLNVGEIYTVHFDLLQELEMQLEQWNSNSVVADVIAKRARFLKLYSDYAKGFDAAREAYIRWLKTSRPFRELIEIIESSRSLRGDHVPSFMILPIQRVPRYKLLLEDYLKYLPEEHPDVVNTKAALAVISETAVHMNSTIVDLEGQALVLKIQERFIGKDILVAPGRRFVGRSPVTFIPSGGKEKEMILFLFSDILLVATSTTRGRYKIHHKLYLKDLLVKVLEPSSSSSSKNAFCVGEKGASKLLRFCTKSEKERDMWIKKLNRGRAANSDHFTVNKKSEYAPVLHDPEAYDSILAILKDPSFEHSQPSWVRRSPHSAGSVTFPSVVMLGTSARPPTLPSPLLNFEQVDYPLEEGAGEVTMEFQEDEERGERVLSTMSLNPGIDNSLSSYMNQRSVDGKIWRRRWFVLTKRTLICYENHLHDEAIGAIPLAGYKLSLPTEVDEVERCNVLKLTHPTNRTYLFELPSCYDFEKWCAIMKELLESDLNSTASY